MPPPLILIVEDEPAVAELVKFSLRSTSWECHVVANASGAWEILQHACPDLLVLDWMLGSENGLHLLLRIRRDARLCKLPVMMVTGQTNEADRLAGLGSGADDYLTKPFSPRELCARAQALVQRSAFDSLPLPIRVGNVEIDPARCSVLVDGAAIAISRAGARLLACLMAQPGKAFTRRELWNALSGSGQPADERNVDVHVLRLRRAMQHSGGMIRTVRHIGYMFVA